jgi:predicted TIM-barrel fold metal-dependent hydrolase
MDLSSIPIIDHHAHPLLRPGMTSDEAGFRQWFTESTDPEIVAHHVAHTLFYCTGLRWLAQLLDCRPTLDSILKARTARDYAAWVKRLFNDANIELVLCDYGYQGERAYNQAEMQALLPCPVRPILRLETLAEALILQHDTFEAMLDSFSTRVSQAKGEGYVALKSIIAYRSGLDIRPGSHGEAAVAFNALKVEARQAGRVRLASKPLCDYLVWRALDVADDLRLPVQFHTGFGDKDADLRRANPLHLREVIERFQTPIVLLHAGWPFYREAAHLAAIYGHVWLDLSLAIPFATSGIPAMLGDVMGMAPSSKLMFATDAFTMPEIFWLAARWGRWGLVQVLESFVADGFITEEEAWVTAEAILGGNARKLYQL